MFYNGTHHVFFIIYHDLFIVKVDKIRFDDNKYTRPSNVRSERLLRSMQGKEKSKTAHVYNEL